MQVLRPRGLRLLVFAAYLLATTASGLWHIHPTRRDAAADRGAVCSRDLISCDPDAASWHGSFDPSVCRKHLRVGPSPRALADETCPVCQFLAEKPIPAVPAEQVGSACLGRRPVPPGPLPGGREALAGYQVRAPPVVA